MSEISLREIEREQQKQLDEQFISALEFFLKAYKAEITVECRDEGRGLAVDYVASITISRDGREVIDSISSFPKS